MQINTTSLSVWKLAALAVFAPSAWAALQVTSSCPVPSATVNQPYNFQITFTGAIGQVFFTQSGLPAGLGISSSGAITGTAFESGIFQFSIQLVDSSDQQASFNCNLAVAGGITITAACPAPTAVLGVPYSFAISATGSNLSWEMGQMQLPPGLTFDDLTGTFSGTPTDVGIFPIDVFVFNTSSNTSHYRCQLAINPFKITAPCPAPGGMVGASYSFPISVIGTQSLTWTLLAGSLPPGLSLNSTNGAITGIPTTPGTYPFSVIVQPAGTLAAGFSDTYSCSIVISSNALTITTSCPITSLPAALSAAGGTGRYFFSVQGALPAGVQVNSQGTMLIGSLPREPGTYPFTLVVSDGQLTAQKPCGIVVSPPPLQITSGCAAFPIAQGSPASFTLSATGGPDSNYVWSIIGNLPAGLRLSGNVISGTPTAPPGRYDFTVQVASGTSTASVPCSIVISDPALHITSGCPGNGNVGTPYGPFKLTAEGGLGPGTYRFFVSGNLPSGVTLAGDTISGTPDTAGRYIFTINVTSGQQTVSLASCVVAIAAPSIQITGNCPGSPVPVGTPVSIPLTVSGGKAPYRFSFSGPAWLSVSNSAISGTPGASDSGQSAIAVTVTDADGATATFRCSITVSPAPLQLTGACPAPFITPGSAVSYPFTVSGGAPPYKWSISGDAGLSLSSDQGATNTVAGTVPATNGLYSFTISVTDSANSTPVTRKCTLEVAFPPLLINGTCPAKTLDLPLSVSIPLSATGGKAPYSWEYSGPSWMGLNGTSGSSVILSSTGTPDAPGAFSFTVTLSDSTNSVHTILLCTSTINVPPAPPVSITGFTSSGSLLQPVNGGLSVSPAPLLPLTGVVQLSFIPNAFGVTDNPQVVFAGGGRTASFTIAAGQTNVSLPAVQQGTVAGTIHLEIVSLKQGNVDVLTTPHPSFDLVVPRLAPAIDATQISFANETANGFDVIISGFSTPRDVKSVVLSFSASPGATLNGSTSFTVDVSSLFSQYYSSAASQLAGSMFQNLDIPISVNGDKTAIGAVSVIVVNSVGNSTSVSKSRP